MPRLHSADAPGHQLRGEPRQGRGAGAVAPHPVPPSMIHFALDDITVGDIIDRKPSSPGNEADGSRVRRSVGRRGAAGLRDHGPRRVRGNRVARPCSRYLPKHAWSDTPLSRIARVTTPNTWVDEPVEDALQLMTENSLTAIPVLDRESRAFVGSITQPGRPGPHHHGSPRGAVGVKPAVPSPLPSAWDVSIHRDSTAGDVGHAPSPSRRDIRDPFSPSDPVRSGVGGVGKCNARCLQGWRSGIVA